MLATKNVEKKSGKQLRRNKKSIEYFTTNPELIFDPFDLAKIFA